MTSDPSDGFSDWHPADVLAALKKRGLSLAGLSIAHGYHPTAAGKALKRQWPAMEAIIARELDLTPQRIWPSRYDAGGRPRQRTWK
ncbi:MAG: helix-turn-helix domain-containing protein [Acetobacteraceae bacterium]